MTREEYEASLYLAHHGIKGQKWGVRRFQNEDGTLTPRGMKRALKDASKNNKWADSTYQPSSARASFRAGKYAASPSKRNARKLDQANDKDELRYKAAKYVKSELDRKANLEKEYGKKIASAMAYAGKHGIDATDSKTYDAKYRKMDEDLQKIHNELKKFGSYEINSPNGVHIKAYGKTKIKNLNLDDYYVGDYGKLEKRRSEQKSTSKSNSDNHPANVEASNKYSKGFMDYVKKEAGGFHQIDDPELVTLMELEYEEQTGKKASK